MSAGKRLEGRRKGERGAGREEEGEGGRYQWSCHSRVPKKGIALRSPPLFQKHLTIFIYLSIYLSIYHLSISGSIDNREITLILVSEIKFKI